VKAFRPTTLQDAIMKTQDMETQSPRRHQQNPLFHRRVKETKPFPEDMDREGQDG
jgi:hypothetical protein